jgi:hypothetical protein
MLQINVKGSWDKTERWLDKMLHGDIYKTLEPYAERGRAALAAATPQETGLTAASWSYEIERDGDDVRIWWTNTDLDSEGTPIAIMLQYGHGTGTGGYVQGRDYINPVMQPIFDEIANEVWKEVTS